MLERLRFIKHAQKIDRVYQLWHIGSHAKLVYNEAVMRGEVDYIHHEPESGRIWTPSRALALFQCGTMRGRKD